MNKRGHSARCGNQARTGNEEEITIRENSSRIVDEEEKIINKTSIKSVKKFKLKKKMINMTWKKSINTYE